MLRVDNGNYLSHSKNIVHAKKPLDKCITRRQEFNRIRKAACDPIRDEIKAMEDFHRQNACQVHSCVPLKKCMAKVGLHDSNGNFLTNELITANLDSNLRTATNQIGYVYQEKQLASLDAINDALRANNPIAASIADKIARSNAELYGKPHAWDGSDMGYFCVECPEKPKPCPRDICKKADPLFNPEIGIGSDGMEAKRSLREDNLAFGIQQRIEKKNLNYLIQPPPQQPPSVRQVQTAETGVGETLRGKAMTVGQDVGRPTLSQQIQGKAK